MMAIVIIMLGLDIHLISLAIFFVFSSIISKSIKKRSFYRSKGSKRDIIQVYANGGVATLVCIVDFYIQTFSYIPFSSLSCSCNVRYLGN